MARAGAFISIDMDGKVRIERGFVRPEDEPAQEASEETVAAEASGPVESDGAEPEAPADPANDPGTPEAEATAGNDESTVKPLSDRLVGELTAHRTLALREALGRTPDTAFLAVVHALCLSAFHALAAESSLEITGRSPALTSQGPGLGDCTAAKALEARHAAWAARLPEDPADLWAALEAMSQDDHMALLAHCAARTVNAVVEPWTHASGRIRHADTLARAVALDMGAAGWSPTAETYLGRVTKARILEAVRDAKGERAAARIEHLRKTDMAREAERLLAGTGWLPELLRTPGLQTEEATDRVGDDIANDIGPADDIDAGPHEESLPEAAE